MRGHRGIVVAKVPQGNAADFCRAPLPTSYLRVEWDEPLHWLWSASNHACRPAPSVVCLIHGDKAIGSSVSQW